jgi:hypothetical protein
LASFKGHIFVVSPLHLKKSMGLVRGKNDKIDAIRIASFIEKNHSSLPESKPLPDAIKKSKSFFLKEPCESHKRNNSINRLYRTPCSTAHSWASL